MKERLMMRELSETGRTRGPRGRKEDEEAEKGDGNGRKWKGVTKGRNRDR